MSTLSSAVPMKRATPAEVRMKTDYKTEKGKRGHVAPETETDKLALRQTAREASSSPDQQKTIFKNIIQDIQHAINTASNGGAEHALQRAEKVQTQLVESGLILDPTLETLINDTIKSAQQAISWQNKPEHSPIHTMTKGKTLSLEMVYEIVSKRLKDLTPENAVDFEREVMSMMEMVEDPTSPDAVAIFDEAHEKLATMYRKTNPEYFCAHIKKD